MHKNSVLETLKFSLPHGEFRPPYPFTFPAIEPPSHVLSTLVRFLSVLRVCNTFVGVGFFFKGDGGCMLFLLY